MPVLGHVQAMGMLTVNLCACAKAPWTWCRSALSHVESV